MKWLLCSLDRVAAVQLRWLLADVTVVVRLRWAAGSWAWRCGGMSPHCLLLQQACDWLLHG